MKKIYSQSKKSQIPIEGTYYFNIKCIANMYIFHADLKKRFKQINADFFNLICLNLLNLREKNLFSIKKNPKFQLKESGIFHFEIPNSDFGISIKN
ncbi:hypothetical protein [Flavobacterium chungbukense]|uniref:hypothetical protein n=1 Tax=Flavobacterium chungbukense TaxID=877464 RepID=UPI001E44FC5B|nr:hypothetical protein [Flavobacterium chungbukense]MCC4921810.1 hypothetical protein [Flavobacterium chungbukense]